MNWTAVARADGTTVHYDFNNHRFKIVVYPVGMVELYDQQLDDNSRFLTLAHAKSAAEARHRKRMKQEGACC